MPATSKVSRTACQVSLLMTASKKVAKPPRSASMKTEISGSTSTTAMNSMPVAISVQRTIGNSVVARRTRAAAAGCVTSPATLNAPRACATIFAPD